MNITLAAGPLVSLIAGVLILIVPRLLNYIVALYLIVIGLLGLFGGSNYRVGGHAMATPEGALVSAPVRLSPPIYTVPDGGVRPVSSSDAQSSQM